MGFMFCDLHASLKQPFVGGYKFVEFALSHYLQVQEILFLGYARRENILYKCIIHKRKF